MDQDKKLAFLFFIGTCAEQLPAGFIYGPFIDWAGPKIATVSGTLFVVIGIVLLALSDQNFNAYIPAIVLMGKPKSSLEFCQMFAEGKSFYMWQR